jgi:hypothetical protein
MNFKILDKEKINKKFEKICIVTKQNFEQMMIRLERRGGSHRQHSSRRKWCVEVDVRMIYLKNADGRNSS